MRLGTVIGRVTLSQTIEELRGARWLIISPFSREHFQQGTQAPAGMSKEPSLVIYDNLGAGVGDTRCHPESCGSSIYDNLGAGVGDTIGFVEGREAAQPFEKSPPIDAINAALVDNIFYSPFK